MKADRQTKELVVMGKKRGGRVTREGGEKGLGEGWEGRRFKSLGDLCLVVQSKNEV